MVLAEQLYEFTKAHEKALIFELMAASTRVAYEFKEVQNTIVLSATDQQDMSLPPEKMALRKDGSSSGSNMLYAALLGATQAVEDTIEVIHDNLDALLAYEYLGFDIYKELREVKRAEAKIRLAAAVSDARERKSATN